jgi:hypothetical protein
MGQLGANTKMTSGGARYHIVPTNHEHFAQQRQQTANTSVSNWRQADLQGIRESDVVTDGGLHERGVS